MNSLQKQTRRYKKYSILTGITFSRTRLVWGNLPADGWGRGDGGRGWQGRGPRDYSTFKDSGDHKSKQSQIMHPHKQTHTFKHGLYRVMDNLTGTTSPWQWRHVAPTRMTGVREAWTDHSAAFIVTHPWGEALFYRQRLKHNAPWQICDPRQWRRQLRVVFRCRSDSPGKISHCVCQTVTVQKQRKWSRLQIVSLWAVLSGHK